MKIGIIALIYICIFLTAKVATAQECTGDLNYYLDQITAFKAGQDSANLVPFVKCISSPARYYVDNPDSFWSPDFNSKIFGRTWKDYLLVMRALIPITTSSIDSLRLETAVALAYYNYPASNQMLKDYADAPFMAVLFAILNDTTIIGWAEDRYDEAAEKESITPDLSIRNRYIYLGLLYHIGLPDAMPFLNRLIRTESSDKLKAAAINARERIEALHPETK